MVADSSAMTNYAPVLAVILNATASATSRVLPDKLSYTTVARITGHSIP